MFRLDMKSRLRSHLISITEGNATVIMVQESFDLDGIPVAFYRGGAGDALLLLHGSGPGASSMGYWHAVLEPLASKFTVYAMDLIGFGKSGRKPAAPYFDFELWLRQVRVMLEKIGGDPVGIIAHSISASFALHIAASHSCVRGVITTGAMGADFIPNEGTRRVWTCPINREELLKTLRGVVFDQSLIDDAYVSAREPILFAPGYAEYFNTMFQGDPRKYVQAAIVPDAILGAIDCPVLMIHGRDDRPFPPEVSIELAPRIANADLVLLAKCSHSIAVEHPAKLLAMTESFFARER